MNGIVPIKRSFLKDIKTRSYSILDVHRFLMSDGSYDYCFDELRIHSKDYDMLYLEDECINAKNVIDLKKKIERKFINKKTIMWFDKYENRKKHKVREIVT